MTISDAELDGLLDCGDEVIDQLSELIKMMMIIIFIIMIIIILITIIMIMTMIMTMQSLQREVCKQWPISALARWKSISR